MLLAASHLPLATRNVEQELNNRIILIQKMLKWLNENT
jgi:hypothetical protein